jgi:hypothetical protein
LKVLCLHRDNGQNAHVEEAQTMQQALNVLASKGPTWVRKRFLIASGLRRVKKFTV